MIVLDQPSSDEHIASLLEAEGISSKTDDIQIDQDSFLDIVGADDDDLELKRSDVLEMFNAMDIDASGYLTAAELQHFLGSFGQFLSDDRMSRFLRVYDDDGNGRITFEEFERVVVDLGLKVEKDIPFATFVDKTDDDVDTTGEVLDKAGNGGLFDVSFIIIFKPSLVFTLSCCCYCLVYCRSQEG